jgi:hypothetical protein
MVERGFADKIEGVVLSSDTRQRETANLTKYFILATVAGVLAVGMSVLAIIVAVQSAG